MEAKENGEKVSCEYKLRENPLRRKEKVFVGCGAGFGGDRPQAALKLLRTVKELDYLVLECLAERTLAERYQLMMSGGKGYDTRTVKFVRNIASLCSTSKIKRIVWAMRLEMSSAFSFPMHNVLPHLVISVSDWMSMLLPLAVERGTCIITNMGAVDPLGAQQVVLDLTTKLGFDITIAAVYEIFKETSGFKFSYEGCKILEGA